MSTDEFKGAAQEPRIKPSDRYYALQKCIEIIHDPESEDVSACFYTPVKIIGGTIDGTTTETCEGKTLEDIVDVFDEENISLIPALTSSQGSQEKQNIGKHFYVNPNRFKLVEDSSAPQGFVLKNNDSSEIRRYPVSDDFQTPLTADEVLARWRISDKRPAPNVRPSPEV